MKTRWGLSVDQAESRALRAGLAGCPDLLVTVEVVADSDAVSAA